MHEAGLSSSVAQRRLREYGPNRIPEKKTSALAKALQWLKSPIAVMLVLASVLSFVIHHTFDGYFILALMMVNFAISFVQERKADTAIAKLNARLVTVVRTYRDGHETRIPSGDLVPGDVIALSNGEVVPADATVIDSHNFTVNEAVITGESFPKEKPAETGVYSGSFVTTGKATLKITATGRHTYFGKTVFLVERVRKTSLLEQDILRISRFLSLLSIGAVVILTVFFLFRHLPLADLVTLDLSLMIAGIPVSLPTVMTLVIEFGVLSLAKKSAIVRRLSALEDFANVNLLLTDKTGTLTKNEIRIQTVKPYGPVTKKELVEYAYYCASQDESGPINLAILAEAKSQGIEGHDRVVDFIPADSERKRSFAIVETGPDQLSAVSVGAPQMIEQLCSLTARQRGLLHDDVDMLAMKGYRSLAVAVNEGSKLEREMRLCGLLVMADTLEENAASTIGFMRKKGIDVKIVTGDNRAISSEIAHSLNLPGRVVTRQELISVDFEHIDNDRFRDIAVFSEILPHDKYRIVRHAKKYYVVASTGDGINDLAALKEAHVGIAVKNAVDALKASADIVLLGSGIAVIKNAIIESRKIFARLYSYSVYRISESLRLILTITILGMIAQAYPLTPLQLILLAVLNDAPIISLAFNRVKVTSRPAAIKVRERFVLSTFFGLTGVLNSLLLYFFVTQVMHMPMAMIQTLYFLKLTVSGHMLIYVAHTKERWYRFLPSGEVIVATTVTQLIATGLASTGLLMPAALPVTWVVFIWIWAFFWMQFSEAMKILQQKLVADH